MSIEHDQSTRKAMRAGISGENVLRPLDEFSVKRNAMCPSCSGLANNGYDWPMCERHQQEQLAL